MGRGGKAVFKRAAGRKKNYGDDDEEYVAEEEESSYESGTPNEESLDASDAGASSAATEENISNAKAKYRSGYSFNRRRSSDSDYNDWNDDDYDDDEDFSPDANDEEDWEEDSFVLGNIDVSARQGTTMRGGTKQKRKVSKPKSSKRSRKVAPAPGKRKRRRTEASSEDEDNFTANGRKSHIKYSKKVSKRMTKAKKNFSIDSDSFDPDYLTSDDDLSLKVRVAVNNSRNNTKGNSRRKKISKVDSETSDSDFVVSDEDLFDNDLIELAKPRKNSRDTRKISRTSRKQRSVEFKRTDSDNDISEDEVNALKIDRTLNLLKDEGVSAGKKGKVKEADDSGKQLCGICLLEEHKVTIQGILNCCSHYFCFACIMEWSKVESRCPLCKRRFVTITKTLRPDSALELRRHVIRVQKRDQVYQPSEEELRVLLDPYEDVVCMECHLGGDDNLMLLCDICDSSAHTYCVGLGKEVPEGNWYCDCCKLAGEGPLHSQVLDTHGSSSSLMCHCDEEEKASNPQSSSILQRSISLQGQPSSLGPDLNAPPRNFMEGTAVSASPASGAGASTLYARRAIHQHIRLIFSNSNTRLPHAESSRMDIALHTEAVHHSVLEQSGCQFHPSERPNSMYSILSSEQKLGNSREFPHSGSNLVQHTSNGGRNFPRVDDAKKQVCSMVKKHLKKLPREISLDRSTFKKIARKATHTILASCGIHHSRSAVSTLHEPPNSCSHDLYGGQLNLVTGCCHSCFSDYVKHVVKMLVETL